MHIIVTTNAIKSSANWSVPTGNENKATMSSIDDLKKQFPDQFNSIGSFVGKVSLFLKRDAIPSIDAPRKYSNHLKARLQHEFDTMETDGIIRRIEHHTGWCSYLTTSVKKDGSQRVCLDPKRINDNLKRCPHTYQLYNNLTLSLQGRGYSQRRTQGQVTGLSASTKPASQEITTFRTHFGRYCYKRLPFGLCVSQDILQQAMDRILARAPCCVGIADDSVSAANHVCRTIIKRRKRSWKLTYHRKVWCACLLRDNTPCRVYIEDTHTDTVSIFEHRSETLANGVTELFGKQFVIITDHKICSRYTASRWRVHLHVYNDS